MQLSSNLLSISVTSNKVRGKDLLIYSSCLPREHPDIYEEVSRGKTPLKVCMSEEHLDKVGFKIATIIAYSHPKSITVLTMDGSPHCTQLHVMAEQAKRVTGENLEVIHLVVEKGVLVEVSSEAVYYSRHLSKIEEALRRLKNTKS
ncbi:MAG: 4Fe-4S ferredoxin [Thermoprotei archaeon]|nr:MAG: 4Fe-4S ferredoxin [Thermoprotei archaeon]